MNDTSDSDTPTGISDDRFFAIDKGPIRAVVKYLADTVLVDDANGAAVTDLLDRIARLTPEQQTILTSFFDFGLAHSTEVAIRQKLPVTKWGMLVLLDMKRMVVANAKEAKAAKAANPPRPGYPSDAMELLRVVAGKDAKGRDDEKGSA